MARDKVAQKFFRHWLGVKPRERLIASVELAETSSDHVAPDFHRKDDGSGLIALLVAFTHLRCGRWRFGNDLYFVAVG
jgi:hypothetical protein